MYKSIHRFCLLKDLILNYFNLICEGQIPLDRRLCEMSDAGSPIVVSDPTSLQVQNFKILFLFFWVKSFKDGLHPVIQISHFGADESEQIIQEIGRDNLAVINPNR